MNKAPRRGTAREHLAEQRERQDRRRRRMRAFSVAAAAAVVVVVIVVVVVVVRSGDNDDTGRFTGPYAPVKTRSDGTFLMGRPNAEAPVVEVYEDFQCPYCQAFEENNGDTLERLAAQGKVNVVYHILAFVNPTGSTRAAVAARCAARHGEFVRFHNTVYAEQPPESQALSIADLKRMGASVGLSGGKFDQCVTAQAGASAVRQRTKAALAFLSDKLGRQAGTPTLFLNGKAMTVDLTSEGTIEKPILAASPTPVPAPSTPQPTG